MEEQYNSPYDRMRYISGLLLEEGGVIKLVFLKMNNERALAPLMYAFKDITQEGTWTPYSFSGGFDDQPQGAARIVLEELV
ncbi:MAG: hypothetical protein FWF46_05395 [Oscillospiraceae bacterium]|nr:hypothetical protein [Oscillospiraceae bacterium]